MTFFINSLPPQVNSRCRACLMLESKPALVSRQAAEGAAEWCGAASPAEVTHRGDLGAGHLCGRCPGSPAGRRRGFTRGCSPAPALSGVRDSFGRCLSVASAGAGGRRCMSKFIADEPSGGNAAA